MTPYVKMKMLLRKEISRFEYVQSLLLKFVPIQH